MTDRSRPVLAAQALIASLLILMGLGTASAAAEKRIQFNIVAQDLASALNEFARQSAQELLFSTDIAGAKRTSGVVGEFAPTDALRALLQGTGLRYRINDDKTILIEKGDLESAGRARMPASAFMTPLMAAQAMPAFRAAQDPEGDAQDTTSESTSDESAARLGEMTVMTGSHIPGVETASPLFVYGRDDFEKVGAATVQQFIATLPQNFGGGQTEDSISEPGQAFNPGLGTAINLRGLGSSTTLVLIDGRRMALGGQAEFTDVSMIPLTAVERIEVLTDGASATYGSDAIGGVVNFIMKKDYVGAETRLMGGGATRGDGERYQASQSAGAQWGAGGAMFNYEFYSSQATSTLERDFASSAAGQYDIIPQQERHSGFLYAHQDLTDSLKLTGDLLYSKRNIPHYAVFDQFTPEVQDSNIDSQQYAASLGLQLELIKSWRVDLSGSASRSEIDNVVTSPSQLNGNGPREYRSEYNLWSADLRISGDLFQLPAGPMQLAVGGGHRDEAYEFRQAIIGGAVLVPQNEESATSHAAYAELVAPLVGARESGGSPRLLVSLAGRYEDYDTFGRTFDPKIGVRWSPFSAVALRATYGTSFKTPSVLQINEFNAFNSISNLATPMGAVRTVIRNGNNPDLQEETATTWTAGIDLAPESPDGFKAQLTWFDVDYENRIEPISGITNAAAFNDPFYASRVIRRGDIPDDEFNALVAELLSGGLRNTGTCGAPGRDPVTGACREPVTNFNAVLRRGLTNISLMHVSGLDLTLSQRFDTPVGELGLSLNGSFLFDYKQQISAAAPTRDFLNVVTRPIDLRAKASATWSSNGWGATATVNYTDDYSTAGAFSGTTGLPLVPTPVDSWITLDLNLRYETTERFAGSWFDDVIISLVASNLFDKDPPTFEDQIIALGYDTANADPMGRLIFLSMSKRW